MIRERETGDRARAGLDQRSCRALPPARCGQPHCVLPDPRPIAEALVRDRDAVLASITEAVGIHRQLADADPAAFLLTWRCC